MRAVAAAANVSAQRARPLLGTTVAIRIKASAKQAEAALDAAFAAIADVHARMSFHKSDSELARLNRDAAYSPLRCSPRLLRVLRAAQALARASAGKFDASIAARLVERGQLPPPEGAPTPDPRADWRDVECLSDGYVRFRRPLWLDFGGIAKGYAVDRAIAALHAHGAVSGLVNAGGDLRTFGDTTETVLVRDPADPATAWPLLQLRDGAAATSAGYFSARGGHTALIDPSSGDSLGLQVSATVCAPRAIWADALTKVVLADPDTATPLLRRLRAQAVIVGDNRAMRILQ